ncbi:MAG TPA: peptide-methionine (S)-S-oxide reductase, partial [Acidimicrobiia bacterium]
EIGEAPEFYYAEGYHQQYLGKNPNGYDCHARTGVPYPES